MVAAKMFWVFWKNLSNSFSNGTLDKKRGRYKPLDNENEEEAFELNGNSLNNNNGSGSLSKSSSVDTNGNKKGFSSWFSLDSFKSEPEEPDEDYSQDISYNFDEDEGWTCDVCDRAFPTSKRLHDHQQKKRHFGCLQCDSIFPSRQALEHHREQMDHYDFVSDYESDTTTCDSEDEEMEEDEDEKERLL